MYMHLGLARLIFISVIVVILKLYSEETIIAAETGIDKAQVLYGNVLRSYVKDGLVDYKELKSNPGDLDSYLMLTAGAARKNFDKWTAYEQLAFLLNLYNARTLKLILDNYPVGSIKEIGDGSKGPWDDPVVELFGKNVSLNTLENEYIRKSYKEPRIHFALVCAARGCPPLLNEPYKAGTLDAQLESQTRKFLSDQTKNYVDAENKVLRLSPIFLWYAEDFKGQSASVIEFVEPYYNNMNLDDYTVEYTEYDWSLNEISTKKN